MNAKGRAGSARAGVLAMVAATLIWGGTFVVLRDTVQRVSPFALVFARFIASGAIFVLWLALARRRPGRLALAGGAFAGLFAAGCFVLQSLGLTLTSAGSSAFLTCVGTVLAAILAWPLLGERPSRALTAGIALAILGSLLLSLQAGWTMGRGELWTLLGAASYALQILVLARFAPGGDPLVLAATQSVAIALLLSPWAGTARHDFALLDTAGWWRFAYLVLPAAVIAPWLQVRAQQALPAGRIALLFALEPVFALVFALTFGAERFAARWWAGAALILAGVLVVEWRTLAGAPSTPPPARSRSAA